MYGIAKGGAPMAKLTYKGTGRPCRTTYTVMAPDGLSILDQPPKACPNMASRGSDYCLRCKHGRQRAGLPVARTR
jgi:hypothetical protein